MDNKEKLMNKIAVYAQAKEPAMQLLTKIAACSKSKGKKQAVRKMAMPDDLKKAAALILAGNMQIKQAGALQDAVNGFTKNITEMPKNVAGFVQRNAGELGSAAGTAALMGVGSGSLAWVLAKILKAKNPGTIGLTTGGIVGGLSAASSGDTIAKQDKAKRILSDIEQAFRKNPAFKWAPPLK